MEKQRLMNVYVNNLTMMESVNRIHDMIREKQTSYVVEVNVDVVMKMEKDPYLKKISDEADLTLVDGQPLVWISKMKGNTPIREKISGSDLVPELLDELSRENRSVFILGGLGDTAKKAAKKVKKHYPGMSIAGTYAPPLGFEKDAKEIEKINHLVAKTHPDLLLACFGCPKQEKWIYENYKNTIRAADQLQIDEPIVELAREHELMIFSDEIYDRLVMDGIEHTSIASLAPDLFCITLNGLSKSHMIAGFRCGWMVLSGAKEKAKDYIEGLNMLSNMIVSLT